MGSATACRGILVFLFRHLCLVKYLVSSMYFLQYEVPVPYDTRMTHQEMECCSSPRSSGQVGCLEVYDVLVVSCIIHTAVQEYAFCIFELRGNIFGQTVGGGGCEIGQWMLRSFF